MDGGGNQRKRKGRFQKRHQVELSRKRKSRLCQEQSIPEPRLEGRSGSRCRPPHSPDASSPAAPHLPGEPKGNRIESRESVSWNRVPKDRQTKKTDLHSVISETHLSFRNPAAARRADRFLGLPAELSDSSPRPNSESRSCRIPGRSSSSGHRCPREWARPQ